MLTHNNICKLLILQTNTIEIPVIYDLSPQSAILLLCKRSMPSKYIQGQVHRSGLNNENN